MGASNYNVNDYRARTADKAARGVPTFAHHDAIRTGKVAASAHSSLNPRGVKIREARDSAAHPVSIPIVICNDLTGSMGSVPIILQAKEPELMGMFLKDRAAGKKYLGDGYPAIMISGVDDYFAIGSNGSLQVGQFESGIEIDNDLSNLWLTGRGGGNEGESYDLMLYFLARHTAHDHWDKRKRRGHAFVICDEPLFNFVDKNAVSDVIGDVIQDNIPIAQIIKEVKQRYNLFCLIPNQTSHYTSEPLRKGWKYHIGEENVLLLDDPTKICELIVSTVAMCEGTVSLNDLAADNFATGAVHNALVPLSKLSGLAMSAHSAEGLQPVPGSSGGISRL